MVGNRSKIISVSSTGIQFSNTKYKYTPEFIRWQCPLMTSPKVYIQFCSTSRSRLDG